MNRLWKFIEKKDMPYIIAVAVLGTLNHFLYELSGGAAIFALFCPVNESTWEHLKLLFFPYLFASIWQYINWDYQFLLSQAPCRIVRHGFCYYAFLYLYRSRWAPFSVY